LFGKTFQKGLEERGVPFVVLLQGLSRWWEDLKALRDPVAHRIPLYAVPSVISPEEESLYNEQHARAMILLAEKRWEEARVCLDNVSAIGKYTPVFAGKFSSGTNSREIYPQITEDYANLIRIGNAVINFLGHSQTAV
jgi:hypothetical protein